MDEKIVQLHVQGFGWDEVETKFCEPTPQLPRILTLPPFSPLHLHWRARKCRLSLV